MQLWHGVIDMTSRKFCLLDLQLSGFIAANAFSLFTSPSLISTHFTSLFLIVSRRTSSCLEILHHQRFQRLQTFKWEVIWTWKAIWWPTWNENGLKCVVGFAIWVCVATPALFYYSSDVNSVAPKSASSVQSTQNHIISQGPNDVRLFWPLVLVRIDGLS